MLLPASRSRVVVLSVLVVGAVAVALLVDLPSAERLGAVVDGARPWGWLLVVGGYAVAALLPVPKSVLTVAAGAVLGIGVGLAVVLAGATLGAAIAFALARWLGAGTAALDRWPRVVDLLERRGLLAVVVLRLVPLVPFTALNYAAGLSPVRPVDYVLGTAVGMLPGTAAAVTLGAYGSDPGSTPFLLAVAAVVLLVGGGALAARRWHARA
ncbi:VTT domain-containing protein [Rhodococcus antarcticus]|uniref:TVP38/TMEM64 family membrane protein n=1 Tax=Rhodococcus antarcticus TaxID=2987751 RepID=A0ABY6P3F8_9NOCA|nr:VTT domain-containing protein [Rhodococcus antarcticus]UZJ25811.1 VTT domain-containing protein [Rhodococcus antarcticus]